MKLSMSLIAKYLEKYSPEIHILDDTMTIRGVRFFTDQPTASSLEYVYLGQAGSYFQDPRYADALLLANGQNQIICRGADYETLLNDVLSAFEYYTRFEQRLYMAAADHLPMGNILDIIKDAVFCPFLVFDIDGNLIGMCHEDNLQEEHFIAHIRKNDTLGFHTLGQIFIDKHGQVAHDLSDVPQYLHIVGQENIGSVSMYLYQGEEKIGFVLFFASEGLDAAFGMCMEPMLAKYCAEAAEFTSPDSVRRSSHSIMIQLLQKEDVSSSVIEKFEKRLSFSSNAILLLFHSIMIQNYTFRRMLGAEVEASGIPCISCECEKDVAILTGEKHLTDLLRFIQSRIPPENISIGISMPVPHFALLYVAYQQCVFALNAAQGAGIRYCRDLALPCLLQNLRNDPMSANLIHPIIGILQKYDADYDTQLLMTLRTYIYNGCRQSETAQKLHVHLNTLKYRLRRISELSGVDFKDYDELLYIQLSLAM